MYIWDFDCVACSKLLGHNKIFSKFSWFLNAWKSGRRPCQRTCAVSCVVKAFIDCTIKYNDPLPFWGKDYVCEPFIIMCVSFSEGTLFEVLYSCFRCCGYEPSAVFVIDVWKLCTAAVYCFPLGRYLHTVQIPCGEKTNSEVMAVTSFFVWVLLSKTTEKYPSPLIIWEISTSP